MDTYRITHWIELPERLNRLKFRKVLNAMSVTFVTQEWLETRSGLTRAERCSLLDVLRRAGVLEARSGECSTARGLARSDSARPPAMASDAAGWISRFLGRTDPVDRWRNPETVAEALAARVWAVTDVFGSPYAPTGHLTVPA